MSDYENTEVVLQKGGKVVRKVSIKKGKGYKSITKYRKGKRLYTVKKPIHKEHIKLIKRGKFIPGLFNDCKNCKTKKRRGGNDEEMGPDIPDVEPYPVPPDPERFARYEEQMRRRIPAPNEAERLFAGPTPEGKQAIEREKMADEDPLNIHPFNREELQIFSRTGGRRTRRRRGGDAQMNNSNVQSLPTNEIDNERQNMLSQLQQLMTQNQQNTQRFQELDSKLSQIEQMTPDERESQNETENNIRQELDDLINSNNQMQERFEQLRNEYFQRYGTP